MSESALDRDSVIDRTLAKVAPTADDDARREAFAEFQREAQDLEDQGLRGEDLARALGGDGPRVVVRTAEELEAYFGLAPCASST
jgi:hypothetical protein